MFCLPNYAIGKQFVANETAQIKTFHQFVFKIESAI